MQRRVAVTFAALGLTIAQLGHSPHPQPPMPHDYRGVQVHIDGIYITPIPNAPFTAEVQIVSHQKLPDGTEHIVTTRNHIARSFLGADPQRATPTRLDQLQGRPASPLGPPLRPFDAPQHLLRPSNTPPARVPSTGPGARTAASACDRGSDACSSKTRPLKIPARHRCY